MKHSAAQLKKEINNLEQQKKKVEKELERLKKTLQDKCLLPNKIKQSFLKEFKVLAKGKKHVLEIKPTIKIPIQVAWVSADEAEWHLPESIMDIIYKSLYLAEDQVDNFAENFVKEENKKIKSFIKRFNDACDKENLNKHDEWNRFYEEFNLSQYDGF